MLKDLLKYTEVADKRMIGAMLSATPSERAVALFSHILNAQHIWAHRILGLEVQYSPWQVHAASDFGRISENNVIKLGSIFSNRALNTITTYTSAAGVFSNSVADILFHVVNHSTYHRAQVATELREGGITPPVTDYIILKREGLL